MTGDKSVWVKSSATHSTPAAYHTDRDCRMLAKARTVIERDRDDLPEDLGECKICADEATRNVLRGDPQATRRKLLAADPEEFGVTAGGDRR